MNTARRRREALELPCTRRAAGRPEPIHHYRKQTGVWLAPLAPPRYPIHVGMGRRSPYAVNDHFIIGPMTRFNP